MKRNRGITPLAAIMLLSGSVLLAGCKDDNAPQEKTEAPPQPVGVVTLKTQPLKITTDLPGRTSASRIAEVRPQVSGIILQRHFTEGSDVTAGVSLYQIDPAIYQTTYNSAKADLARAQASADIAHLTVKRYKPLLGTRNISQQDYDQAVATARQADATVQAAQAAVESARINLAYTKVTSPISGRAGISTVTEGALVASGQTNAMTTVQQLDPMFVDVTQSSNDFLRLRRELMNGSLERQNGKANVQLLLENGASYPHTGTLEFSDVTVDETTGSITLRAIFPNPDYTLLPGMFVRARLDEGTRSDALLVPQRGVARNPRGEATAMVVGADNKAEMRILTAAQAIGNQWLITDGLKAGDRLIVSGLQKIRPGGAVIPQEASPEAAPSESEKKSN